jgi:hypothetical protein
MWLLIESAIYFSFDNVGVGIQQKGKNREIRLENKANVNEMNIQNKQVYFNVFRKIMTSFHILSNRIYSIIDQLTNYTKRGKKILDAKIEVENYFNSPKFYEMMNFDQLSRENIDGEFRRIYTDLLLIRQFLYQDIKPDIDPMEIFLTYIRYSFYTLPIFLIKLYLYKIFQFIPKSIRENIKIKQNFNVNDPITSSLSQYLPTNKRNIIHQN